MIVTNHAKSIANKANFTLTSARETILNILINATKPICYEDIKDSIAMDKATFYRNINKFEEDAIINAFEAHDKKRYFEIKKHKHAHFVCISCNAIECIHANINTNLSKEYQVKNIIINGICAKCNSEA